jgi:hypothetical protein
MSAAIKSIIDGYETLSSGGSLDSIGWINDLEGMC